MSLQPDRATDHRLLDAILAFVAAHPANVVDRFRDAVANWGHDWSGVAPTHLPASDRLKPTLSQTVSLTRELLTLFVRHRASLHWEQAYTHADSTVADHMLANYGYAEIIGKQGPFLSAKVRAGIAIYGPMIDYPLHHHLAEEIYVVLAGAAGFRVGEDAPVIRTAGNVIHHPPLVSHGLHTANEPVVIFYLWKGGDLREKPAFA